MDRATRDAPAETDLASALQAARTDHGDRLAAMSDPEPLLLVFVRHSGCTFCGETLADLAKAREPGGPAASLAVAVVQMGTLEQGRRLLDRHGLTDVPVVSDPDRSLYRAVDLGRGGLGQLFGLRVWWRAMGAIFRGHFIGRLVGDGFQMPGAFIIRRRVIVKAFRHDDAGERTDFAGLCRFEDGPTRDA